MLDFRYHAFSLVAVILAFVIGILAGVGISGRGYIDDAERGGYNRRIADLERQATAARDRADELERRQAAAQDFVVSAYPALVEGRLTGKRIAVLVVGSLDPTYDGVRRAIADAGGTIVRMRAITVPLDVDRIEQALGSDADFGGYVGLEQLDNVGRDLGRELVAGQESPLWDALSDDVVEERAGVSSAPADGVVVIRTVEPQEGDTARFLAGLYAGLAGTGSPAVGVELSRVQQSAIPVFQKHRLSSVDGVDTPLGRLALALLLGGADPGDYGIRDTADSGILPPIEPLPAVASGG